MAGKDIRFDEEARGAMLKGVDTLANAVKVTLGQSNQRGEAAPSPRTPLQVGQPRTAEAVGLNLTGNRC